MEELLVIEIDGGYNKHFWPLFVLFKSAQIFATFYLDQLITRINLPKSLGPNLSHLAPFSFYLVCLSKYK